MYLREHFSLSFPPDFVIFVSTLTLTHHRCCHEQNPAFRKGAVDFRTEVRQFYCSKYFTFTLMFIKRSRVSVWLPGFETWCILEWWNPKTNPFGTMFTRLPHPKRSLCMWSLWAELLPGSRTLSLTSSTARTCCERKWRQEWRHINTNASCTKWNTIVCFCCILIVKNLLFPLELDAGSAPCVAVPTVRHVAFVLIYPLI